MPSQLGVDRSGIAQKLVAARNSIAQSVSDQFFLIHPDWLVKYGERGRQFCTEDARFHLDFLCGALEAGSPESFADYALWTARMLGARGIPAHSLEENFAQIAVHLAAALSPEEHAEVSRFLDWAKTACREEPASTAELENGDGALKLSRDVFLAAILNGQRQAALNIVEETLRAGHSHVDIYVDVIGDSLHRVGKLWELNRVSVAQEHMATALTQFVISSIYPKMIPDGPPRGQMVVTGVAGEQHQIGANLVADAMESKGWSVRFLGSNSPLPSILEAINESSADVLCISTTLVSNLPSAAQLIRSVRSDRKERAPRIVVGGAAYRYCPQFVDEIGCLGVALDLRAALSLLCG
jgi:MerR family transcriptional regulator, light-induced transcriptional regulator